MLFGAFQPPSPRRAGPPRSFPGAENQELASILLLKGWRRAKKLNLIRAINPEFKDLEQSWGWKMITVHEKMYVPVAIKCVSQQILLSGVGGRKAPSSMGK
jgi:hypothetical protein